MNAANDPGRAIGAVGAAAAALVRPRDVVGTTIRLLAAAAGSVGAAGAGLVMRRLGQDDLQLLAATSHRTEEFELYQAQQAQGPCFDAVETGQIIDAAGRQIGDRWPQVAGAFQRAGYTAVQAVPLRWHRDVIGALNFFWADEQGAATADPQLGELFADLATLTIIHSDPVTATQILQRTGSALDERTVIEQAKGVLAEQQHLSMDAAYLQLLEIASGRDQLIGAAAAEIVDRASRQPTSRQPVTGTVSNLGAE